MKYKKDKNVFKVNLGHGIETLTYYELQARFLCLTEEEQKYLDENVRHCTSLSEIPEELFNSLNVISFSDVFNGCKSLTNVENFKE